MSEEDGLTPEYDQPQRFSGSRLHLVVSPYAEEWVVDGMGYSRLRTSRRIHRLYQVGKDDE
jgi:hypothetical protein